MGAVWNVFTFLLNGLAFILIGLQLPEITDGLGGYAVAELAWSAALVSLVVALVRFAWVFPASYLPHLLYRGPRELDPYPSRRNVLVVSWAGMRGVISLAAALALPITTPSGNPFPGRDLILFLTFSVILATLVVQGLSLPLLIRTLGLADDGLAEREEVSARLEATEAALTRLSELAPEPWVRDGTAERLWWIHSYRRSRFSARSHDFSAVSDDNGKEDLKARSSDYRRLVRELVHAQRAALLRLRNDDHVADDVFRRVMRELELEEAQLER